MTKKDSVTVILPSFNEVSALPSLTEDILKVFKEHLPEFSHEVIVVDDNSTDGTIETMEDKFSGDERVRMIVRKDERGLASAVFRGIRESGSEYVLVMDSDFNHPPAKIIELVKNAKNFHMVSYSRYIRGGGMNTDNRLFRYWGSRVYNKFLQKYLGLPTNDNLSGFFIARKEDIMDLPTEVIFDGYGEFFFGIIYFMKKKFSDLRIKQFPIVYEKRKGGVSKTRFAKTMVQYFKKARVFKAHGNRKKVLVTYGRNRIAYVSLRSLSRAGYEVHVGDCVWWAMSFFSRYARGRMLYHSPFSDEEAFIRDLIGYIKKNKIDILLPSHEEGFVISKHRDKLVPLVKLLVPSYDLIWLASNKAKMEDCTRSLGIPCPRTFCFASLEEFGRFLGSEIRFPLVIKLQKSRGSIGLCYAFNKKELKKKFIGLVKKFGIKEDYPIVQEYVDGYGLGVSMLYKDGKDLASFTHKRLIEMPLTGGTSVERVSVHNAKAEEMARRILGHLHWNGAAMVEFKVDRKTGDVYFLEINPRFWGSLNQAVVSGVDFPLLICRTLERKEFPYPDYKDGIRTRWFWGSVFVFPSCLFGGKYKEAKKLLNVFDKNLYFDDISWKDPLPFLVNPVIPLINLATRGKITFETKDEEVINFNK